MMHMLECISRRILAVLLTGDDASVDKLQFNAARRHHLTVQARPWHTWSRRREALLGG